MTGVAARCLFIFTLKRRHAHHAWRYELIKNILSLSPTRRHQSPPSLILTLLSNISRLDLRGLGDVPQMNVVSKKPFKLLRPQHEALRERSIQSQKS